MNAMKLKKLSVYKTHTQYLN